MSSFCTVLLFKKIIAFFNFSPAYIGNIRKCSNIVYILILSYAFTKSSFILFDLSSKMQTNPPKKRSICYSEHGIVNI